MAITITKVDEDKLKEEFSKKGFSDLKKYVEWIVMNRHKISENQPSNVSENSEVELLQKRLSYASTRAIKAGVNRSDLAKELSKIV